MKKILFGNNNNIIYKQLKFQRIKANLTQGELAAKMQIMGINVDQQTVSRIERNERIVTDYELTCLCRILHVSEQDLLQDFEKKQKELQQS